MSATATVSDSAGVGRAGEALGLWEPKRALTLEAARAHTKRIRILRYCLLAAAAGLIVALVVQFMSDRGGLEIVASPSESVKMVNPRYSGRTADGLPFYLTADSATRTLADRNAVALVNPVLEFIRDEGLESSFLVAKSGSYDDMNKILNLREDVDLETDDGYVCQTTHARIFARDKRIEGDEPIDCTGSFGRVDGQTYAIEDAYKTFIFKDGMTARIDNNGSTQADEDLGFGGDGPIDILAERGTYRGATTELTGDVRVEQDGAIVTSQVMDIFRNTTQVQAVSDSLRLGAIERIDAREDFRYVTTENDIRGEKGVYERAKKIMTVTGDVTVDRPGGNRVEAEELIYDTASKAVSFSGNETGRVDFTIKGSGSETDTGN
jgi:lipopolysaccharide transport protein LptA